MIILDANFLITLSKNSSDSAELYSFLESLGTKQIIGIPAPSWAEFLAGSGSATSTFANALRNKSSVQILPFDEMAAIECGIIDQELRRKTGSKKGQSLAPWQKIKIDRQILAIASARGVTAIYTDDDGLISEARLLGLLTVKMSALPRTPFQISLLSTDGEADIPTSESSNDPW